MDDRSNANMSPQTNSNAGPSVGAVYFVVFVLSLVILGVGAVFATQGKGLAVLASGCASVVAVLVAWPIALRLGATSTGQADMLRQANDRLDAISQRLDRVSTSVALIGDQQLISDRAKQVAFREKDREAFRRAIQEDLSKNDYEAAIALVDDMDREFGYKAEAGRLRTEVMGRRDEAIKRQIDSAMQIVDRHIEAEQWQAAFKEAERLKGLYPTQIRIQNLPAEIEGRRQRVKQQLLQRWSDHVKAKDPDMAIGILKKLDMYLTPAEASTLQEDARMIFKEKLGQLRTKFTSAVQEHNWKDAVTVGEQIIAEFPNTTMAQEVRSAMDAMKERVTREPSAV
jgi:hypothetical protein